MGSGRVWVMDGNDGSEWGLEMMMEECWQGWCEWGVAVWG